MRDQHILNSASNLFGASLVIVTALHITKFAPTTYADELSFGAAILLLGCCLTSYQSIRTGNDRYEAIADKLFILAQLMLLVAMLSFWF
ncbi:MAG: hypothetical protein H7268_01105 [Sandarakinorhabdus sp.]|nr:hypothetical protein [Sandarakinorhabdus sp.]